MLKFVSDGCLIVSGMFFYNAAKFFTADFGSITAERALLYTGAGGILVIIGVMTQGYSRQSK
ncbi:hypothetical protein [Serratia liquefaciens]|uniref:hypothetical protein n=1 Tax=Serratia liquefaciens TaxID=614 RepID=UPI0039061E13